MNTKSCLLSLFASLLLSLTASAAEIRGVILKADAAKNQLTIEGRGLGVRGAVVTVQLDTETQIQVGRRPAKVVDLTPGRRVRVVYDFKGDQRVALLITLQGGQPNPAPPAIAAAGKGDSVSGTLRRVSVTEREIVVIGPPTKGGEEAETTVSVPADVQITKDQKAIPFEDLKEGDPVLVQIEKRDNKLWAKSIQLGIPANANPNPEPGQNQIERIRKALKLIDFVLQMMDQKSP